MNRNFSLIASGVKKLDKVLFDNVSNSSSDYMKEIENTYTSIFESFGKKFEGKDISMILDSLDTLESDVIMDIVPNELYVSPDDIFIEVGFIDKYYRKAQAVFCYEPDAIGVLFKVL